jgi:rod shape-determining protein MreC
LSSLLSLTRRYRELLVVSVLLAYPFVTFLTRARRPREPGWTDRVILATTSPLERGLTGLVEGTGSLWHGYVALRGVEARNRLLEADNAKLRGELVTLSELSAENARLHALVGYTPQAVTPRAVARVVGVNPVATFLSVRIDRGEAAGVHKGMPVVTPEGVVGQVVRTAAGYADVVLVEDPNSRIGVRIQRTRARAMAAGAGGELPLKLDSTLRREDLQENDQVITSGADGIFPPGLLVGRLFNVRKKVTGMFQQADIAPAVNPTHLEEVMVLDPPLTSPPDEVLAPPPMTVVEAPPK